MKCVQISPDRMCDLMIRDHGKVFILSKISRPEQFKEQTQISLNLVYATNDINADREQNMWETDYAELNQKVLISTFKIVIDCSSKEQQPIDSPIKEQ